MSYRVQYSDEAKGALRTMAADRRVRFGKEITRLAKCPYEHGVPLGGNRDRRQAELAGTLTVYWVSAGVLTVSVVRIVHTD